MPRAGAEPKPPWQRVPLAVRRQTAALLGSPVVRAARIWGGYAPSPTFRLRLADGRRAFFKGVNQDSNEFMTSAMALEERFYRQLAHLVARWVPSFFGSFASGAWRVLLLEDLGPSTIPPWNRSRVRTAARSYAEFHRATLGRRLPRWVADRPPWKGGIARSWDSIGRREEQRREFAALAGARAAEAQSWIETHLAALQRVSLGLATTSAPHALLHFDTRSDNIRLRGGELKIFDWPFACAGPPELDAAAFAQSIPCEGGPAPEYFLAAYAQRLPVRERIIASSVAALAGFFAERAWRPAPPGLPRVRSIQRRQLKSSLAWAARILALPEPSWLEAVPD